jgi:hypothetical protein
MLEPRTTGRGFYRPLITLVRCVTRSPMESVCGHSDAYRLPALSTVLGGNVME